MKTLTLITLALTLTACGHATTTLDRELALKLADRPQVIVASSPAPIINVNNYSGGGHTPTAAPYQASQPFVDDRTKNCTDTKQYDNDGQVIGTKRICFGAE